MRGIRKADAYKPKRLYHNIVNRFCENGILSLLNLFIYCYSSEMIDPSSSEEDSEDEHRKQPAKLPGKDLYKIIRLETVHKL